MQRLPHTFQSLPAVVGLRQRTTLLFFLLETFFNFFVPCRPPFVGFGFFFFTFIASLFALKNKIAFGMVWALHVYI